MRDSSELQPLARFVALVFAFAATLFTVLWGAGAAFSSLTPWQRAQDPRRRILWEPVGQRVPIVILGDSVFCSYYVDRPQDTLWAQLESHLGQEVYPGALNGATEEDMVAAARQAATIVSPGGVVVLDLIPSRFIRMKRAGNGRERPMAPRHLRSFEARGVAVGSKQGARERLEGKIYSALATRLFLVGYREPAWEALAAGFRPFKASLDHKDRIWNRDGTFAQKWAMGFLSTAVFEAPPPAIEWVFQAAGVVRAHGAQPLIALTPWCEDVLRAYAPLATAEALIRMAHTRRAEARDRLGAAGIEVVDLEGSVPSACFADLLHTNACGDARVAEQLAGPIRRMLRASPAGKGPLPAAAATAQDATH